MTNQTNQPVGNGKKLQTILGVTAAELYRQGIKAILCLVAVIGVMFVLHLIWWKTGILITAFVVGAAIAIYALAPTRMFQAGTLGATIAFFRDTATNTNDKTVASLQGIVWLSRALRAVLAAFFLSAFVLYVWDFRAAPETFWFLIFAIILGGLWVQMFKKKSGIVFTGVLGFIVVMTIIQLWPTAEKPVANALAPISKTFAARDEPPVRQASVQPVVADVAPAEPTVKYPEVMECKEADVPEHAVLCQLVTIYPSSEGGKPHEVRAPPAACLYEDKPELVVRTALTEPLVGYHDYVPSIDRKVVVRIVAMPIGHWYNSNNPCGS